MGYNSSGKTLISKAIAKADTLEYKTLVYNVKFVEDNFLGGGIEGIFTLGEKHVADEKALTAKKEELKKQTEAYNKAVTEFKASQTALSNASDHLKDAGVEVRKEVQGAQDLGADDWPLSQKKQTFVDKVEKYRGEKLIKERRKIEDGIKLYAKELKEKAPITVFDDARNAPLVKSFAKLQEIANNLLLREVIVGAEDSYLSSLIKELKNSDWVADGRKYIQNPKEKCPFCQQNLPGEVAKDLEAYFDESYKKKKGELGKLLETYENEKKKILEKLEAVKNPDYKEYVDATKS